MKTCTICKESKRKSEYNKHAGRKDGLQNICKECGRRSSKRYYTDNRIKHRAVIKKKKQKYTEECRLWIYKYLKEHPCVDCGESDIVVLEFDHRENKVTNISHMLKNNPTLKTIQREVAKCDVRCSNCHKRRTAKDQGWWKLTMGV